MNFSGRSYGIAALTVFATILAIALDAWDLSDRLREKRDATTTHTQPVPVGGAISPTPTSGNIASRVTARLACTDLILSQVAIEARETPATKTASAQLGHYLTAQFDATLDGQFRLINAEGNGKGPGAESNATTMLVENLAGKIKLTFPEC